jgi:hypothetical protein
MPIVVVDQHSPNEIVAVVSGEVGLSELTAFSRAYRSGERRSWAMIFDATGAVIRVASADMRDLAAFAAAKPQGLTGPVAIVAPTSGTFGLSRMYQTFSELNGRTNVGVFRSLEKAREWIAQYR